MFYIRFEHRQVVEEVTPQELLAAAPRPDGEPEPAQQLLRDPRGVGGSAEPAEAKV
jgi:hypothetical protein